MLPPRHRSNRGDENADCPHEATLRVNSVPYQWHHIQEFRGVLKAPRRVFLQEHPKENDERLRDTFKLFNRYGGVLMLIHDLGG